MRADTMLRLCTFFMSTSMGNPPVARGVEKKSICIIRRRQQSCTESARSRRRFNKRPPIQHATFLHQHQTKCKAESESSLVVNYRRCFPMIKTYKIENLHRFTCVINPILQFYKQEEVENSKHLINMNMMGKLCGRNRFLRHKFELTVL